MRPKHRTISKVASLTGFLRAIKAFRARSPHLTAFRGQKNAAWFADAHLLRPGMEGLRAREKEAVRDIIALRPEEFRHDKTMFDQLVRMQHFGLPTRLLDVSTNPLVALYFATEPNEPETNARVWAFLVPEDRIRYFDSDTLSALSNLANLSETEKEAIRVLDLTDKAAFNSSPAVDRLLQFIRAEKPHFRAELEPEDLFKPYYVIPKMDNPRIVAQTGAFVIYGLDEASITLTYKRTLKRGSFLVRADHKAGIRAELEGLGFNDYTLFPDIERAAKNIVRKYK